MSIDTAWRLILQPSKRALKSRVRLFVGTTVMISVGKNVDHRRFSLLISTTGGITPDYMIPTISTAWRKYFSVVLRRKGSDGGTLMRRFIVTEGIT